MRSGRSRGTGRRALRLTSRSTRAPGSRQRSPPAQRACSGRRLLHEFPAQLVRKRLLASTCCREHQSEVHVRCVVVGAKRKSLAVRCDARPPSLDARSIAVLAGAARHGSRMHDPRCGATRLLWHRQSRHLASIHAPLRRGGTSAYRTGSTASLKSCPRARGLSVRHPPPSQDAASSLALAQSSASLASIRRRRLRVVSGFGSSAVSLNAIYVRFQCGSVIVVPNTHERSGRLHGCTELPSRCIST